MTVLDTMYVLYLFLPTVPPLCAGIHLEQAQYGGRLARFHSGNVIVPEHGVPANRNATPGGAS
jgi:hypothetical protein